MTQEIINLKEGATTETLKLNESDLWFSSKKHKTAESMKKTVEKNDGGMLNYHGIIKYDTITRILLNEKSSNVVINYPNKKGKNKELELSFDNIESAHKIGEVIASKTKLSKNITKENINNRLLLNLLWPIGAIVITTFIALNDELETNDTSYSKWLFDNFCKKGK